MRPMVAVFALVFAVAGYFVVSNSRADSSNLSGLAWPSGAYAGNDLAANTAFGKWRGSPLDVIGMYTNRSSWSSIADPGGIAGYKDFAGRLVISQPLWPVDASGAALGDSSTCAAGGYDVYWKQFGANLIKYKRPDAIVRLGWAGNGNFLPWSATAADLTTGNWKNCWRRAAKAIKAADSKVVLDWTINAHGSFTFNTSQPYDAYGESSPLYPGDDVVDIIGINSYDKYADSSTAEAFDVQCNASGGLCQAVSFAAAHEKKFSVGEWGGSSCGAGNPGGDNLIYIQKMFDLFQKNASSLAYESYYSDSGSGGICSAIYPSTRMPELAGFYRSSWGPSSPAKVSPSPSPTPQASETPKPASGFTTDDLLSPTALALGAPLILIILALIWATIRRRRQRTNADDPSLYNHY